MIVGNLVRNFNEGGNFHEYDINMGICMSDHFVAVLAHPKLPNWMTFICMAPVVLLAKVMEAKDIYAVLNSSSLHLMIIICMFSGMIAATGLDIIIGDFVDHMTSSQTGKRKK